MYKNLFACVLLLGCANTAAPAPEFAAKSVCNPIFKVDGQDLAAGKAFLIDWPSAPNGKLILTAIHLFGPNGGLEADISANELPNRVVLSTCQMPDSTWKKGTAIHVEGAKSLGTGMLTDLAAFTFAQSKANSPALKLASTNPRVGETVWLVSQTVGGDPSVIMHQSTVTYSGDDAIEYEFSNKTISFRATSGAPIVNSSGHVVGINLGGGEVDGKILGFATSASTIQKLLKQ